MDVNSWSAPVIKISHDAIVNVPNLQVKSELNFALSEHLQSVNLFNTFLGSFKLHFHLQFLKGLTILVWSFLWCQTFDLYHLLSRFRNLELYQFFTTELLDFGQENVNQV